MRTDDRGKALSIGQRDAVAADWRRDGSEPSPCRGDGEDHDHTPSEQPAAPANPGGSTHSRIRERRAPSGRRPGLVLEVSVAEGRLELRRACETVGRQLLQGSSHDRNHVGRHGLAVLVDRPRILGEDLGEHRLGEGGRKRRSPGEHLVEHGSQRIHVAAGST